MLLQLDAEVTSYASELSTKCQTTYSHAVKVMNRMQEYGLVKSEKKGRKKIYELTDEGKDFVDRLQQVEEYFDSDIKVESKFSSSKLEEIRARQD
jgi:predicted transcriptional regulator